MSVVILIFFLANRFLECLCVSEPLFFGTSIVYHQAKVVVIWLKTAYEYFALMEVRHNQDFRGYELIFFAVN